jgi:hypothetical protein
MARRAFTARQRRPVRHATHSAGTAWLAARFLALLLSTQASAEELLVPAQFATIQAAINAAQPFDTVVPTART